MQMQNKTTLSSAHHSNGGRRCRLMTLVEIGLVIVFCAVILNIYSFINGDIRKVSTDDDSFHILWLSDADNDENNDGDNETTIVDTQSVLTNTSNTNDTANDGANVNDKYDANGTGAFLHVGKTAGSTLSQLLRNGCHSYVPKPCLNNTLLPPSRESYVSKLTTYYHVPDFEDQSLYTNHEQHPYDFFVITTRDPLQRAISSFVYSHPTSVAAEKLNKWKVRNPKFYDVNTRGVKNKNDREELIKHVLMMGYVNANNVQMYKCFNTLEQYAQLLSDFTKLRNSTAPTLLQRLHVSEKTSWKDYLKARQCNNVAKSTFLHLDSQPMTHHYWDLQEILYQVHENLHSKPKYVIRQEYLWDDWISANRYLGDTAGTIHTTNKTIRIYDDMNIPKKMQVNRTLSEDGRKNLCFALEQEYRLYLRLLVLAVNLSKEDVENSYVIAKKSCPWLGLKLPGVDDKEVVTMAKSRGQWEL